MTYYDCESNNKKICDLFHPDTKPAVAVDSDYNSNSNPCNCGDNDPLMLYYKNNNKISTLDNSMANKIYS